MPAFSGQFDWDIGLVWQVGFIAGNVLQSNQGVLHMSPALVDTGASKTCISKSIAEELGLLPTGKIDMQTAGGIIAANVYEVQIAFVFANAPDSKFPASGEGQVVARTQVSEFDPGKNPYRAPIGRDILRLGVLSMSFDGHYSFSY
ncbi:MAG: retropepsin-like aspartic protease [Paracoccaceae bacterium]|nr:retropepsin-like aspartic protease [Paracoccaceae bacterium]